MAGGVVLGVPSVGAQGDRILSGQAIEVSNGTECAPGAEGSVAVRSDADPTDPGTVVATFVADETGHFETALPSSFRLEPGAYAIVVECGAQGGDLVYPVTVVAAETPVWQQPMVLGAVAAVVALGALLLLVNRRRKAGSDFGAAMAAEAQITEPMAFLPASVAEDHDDGAEYWVWDVVTEAGSRKRIACLTEQCFHLHELGEHEFAAMLHDVQQVGPDAALARSFFRAPVADISDVARRDSLLRIVTTSGRQQVIDLGSASPDVFAMLRRRLGDGVCREISAAPALAAPVASPATAGYGGPVMGAHSAPA